MLRLMLILAMLGICSFSNSCSLSPECEDTIKDEVSSPDGKHVASWAVRNCGATTDYSSLVRIDQSAQPSADDDVVFIVKGDSSIKLNWQSNSVLAIHCESGRDGDIFKRIASKDEITIIY